MAKKKKVITRRKPVKSTTPADPAGVSSDLNTVSVAELRQELARRGRHQSSLERRREKLLKQLAEVESELAGLGAQTGTGRRTRPKNEMNLEDALVKTLKGKTMSVTELSAAVQQDGYKTNSVNFRTIVNQALLRNKKKFKKVSRGQYTTA